MGDFVNLFIKVRSAGSYSNSKFFNLADMLSVLQCRLVFIVAAVYGFNQVSLIIMSL